MTAKEWVDVTHKILLRINEIFFCGKQHTKLNSAVTLVYGIAKLRSKIRTLFFAESHAVTPKYVRTLTYNL